MRIGLPLSVVDRRTALVPETVARLVGGGHTVVAEAGCGEAAGYADGEYEAAGASMAPAGTPEPWSGDLVVVVTLPDPGKLRGGAVLGFLSPFQRPEAISALAEAGVTAFAFEAVPRTTRAQALDALSSQATAAGYAAAALAAASSDRFFPMLTTAAGTIRPASVVVLGAGVAGLQAMATCRRLGAVVSGFDVRPEAAEQIRSVGATPIPAPVTAASSPDGYARAVEGSEEETVLAALEPHVAAADVVITTAAVPGRRAPVLVTAGMVGSMRRGAVVVDVSASTGGNCELTVPGETRIVDGVLILGYTDLASRVARDASRLLSRNSAAFIDLVAGDDGAFRPPWDDDVVSTACVTRDGAVIHPLAAGAAP